MVSHKYFMDEMQYYEIPMLVEHIPYKDRVLKEQFRFLQYIQVQRFNKKKLKLKDVQELPFDKEFEKALDDYKDKEIKEIKIEQKLLESFLNKKEN